MTTSITAYDSIKSILTSYTVVSKSIRDGIKTQKKQLSFSYL